MVVGILAEGSKEHFESEIDNILSMITPLMNETNPRLVWATLGCLALLC